MTRMLPPRAEEAEDLISNLNSKVEERRMTYQLVVVDNHQLDVLGLRLDGALTSSHLQGARQSLWVPNFNMDSDKLCFITEYGTSNAY